jgi:hypothetical protein
MVTHFQEVKSVIGATTASKDILDNLNKPKKLLIKMDGSTLVTLDKFNQMGLLKSLIGRRISSSYHRANTLCQTNLRTSSLRLIQFNKSLSMVIVSRIMLLLLSFLSKKS